MKKVKNRRAPSPLQQRRACTGRWTLSLLLTLMSLLGFSPQVHAVDIGREYPEVVAQQNLTPDINAESHVAFSFVWFNYNGSNSYFDTSRGDVYLYIDGEQVLNLSELVAQELSGYTCQMFNCKRAGSRWTSPNEDNASDLVDDHKGQFLCKGSFTGKRFNAGTIALSNPSVNGNSKAYKITADICLEEWQNGITHEIAIVGPWNLRGTAYDYTPTTTPCKVTVNAPVFTAPPAPTIKRTGNLAGTFTVNQLTQNYTTHQVNGSSTVSKFVYSAAAWTAQPTDRTPGNDYWGWGNSTGNGNRILWTDIKDGSTSKTFDLNLSSNYNPVTVYPRMRLWTDPAYEMNPSGAGTIVPQMTCYNQDYAAVTLPGYPRPIGLVATPDMWSRKVTLTWTPEVSDSKNYNAYGKWVIFRKKTGQPATQIYCGETSVGTYAPGKEVKFVYAPAETENIPDYGQQYTYMVAFQPDDWGLGSNHLDNEGAAAELNTFVRNIISRINPLVSITATKDQENSIKVDWTFNSFEDATTSKKYLIHLYRREKAATGQTANVWEEIHTQEVTSATTTSGTYNNTGIGNPRTVYEYKAEVEALGTKFTTPNVAEGKIDGSSRVLAVTASRGAYSGVVRINWTAKQVGTDVTYYTVKRRLLGTDAEYQEIYTTSGVATSYSYEDATAQPGCYYQYMVDCYNVEGGVTYPGSGAYTDGFALATGVVNGRVSYGSGTAVEGVKVSLVNTSASDDPQSQFRSMNFADVGVGAGLLWTADADKIKDLFVGKSWMVEVNVFPDAEKMNVDGKEYIIWDCYNTATLKLKYRAATNDYTLTAYLEGKNHESFIKDIPANQWSTVALGINAENGHWGVAAVYPDGRVVHGTSFRKANGFTSSQGTAMSIGNAESLTYAYSFAGNIDEFRFFTRFLSEDEIKQNYNHRLSGSEDGLAIYYPMDEGLNGQTMVYDYSRTGGISNGRHATVAPNTYSSTNVPSAEQFSICAYTDKNGNYSVSGIPFSGDGTSYSVIPTLGIHQFSPSEANRYISAQSLVHNGVDFTDVSSFPVRGRVVYEGTTFPVGDATIYVDGIIAGRDGAAVTTNDEGEFIVDVPIGSHYISVKKNGHTFRFDGRYPADPDGVGTKYVFEQSREGLTFYDTTLVPVAGRVVGGDIQDAYPLGFGLSTANIGQATIVLEAEGNHLMNATDELQASSEARTFDTSIITKGGTATVGAYDAADPTAVRTITVTTDAKTGEFAAMLPPLKYNVKSIRTASYNFPSDNLPLIDATNPLVVNTDSIEVSYDDSDNKETRAFEYVASMKKKYKSEPTLEITGNNPDGSFGDAKVGYTDPYTAKVDSVSMYDKAKGTYTFGAPVFRQLEEYTFSLRGYEEYVNNDDPKAPVTDLVPLADVEVDFQNEFELSTGVNPDDPTQVNVAENGVVTLDEEGLGKYTFRVGLPNIVSPFKRNLTVTYNVDGQTYTWKNAPWALDKTDASRGAFDAYVLGQMPSGNNFMTSGPDKVLMILRDPAGTGSNATWAEGSTVTHTEKQEYNFTSENELNTTTYLGVEQATAEGIGFMVIQDLESKANLEVGAELDIKVNHADTRTTTTTTTKEISTSDGSDFVGSVGDVFVGTATNIIFGDARTVCLQKDGDGYTIDVEDQITLGQQFGTSFSYTQNYIEGVLIPTFEEQRDALLLTVGALDEAMANRPAAGTQPKYETLLTPDDDNFGQPGTYLMIEPEDYKTAIYEDRVNWYNMQIDSWIRILARNEQAKVTAIQNRTIYLKDNYSFDAGAGITETVETEKSKEWENQESEEIKVSVGAETGFRFSGAGLSVSLKTTDGEEFVQTQGGSTSTTTSYSFNLAEDGDDDYLSVDVYGAPDGFGPIFVTRGGATCCPYEDEVVTKYYQPGTVISEKTVQIEKPEIAAVGYASITGVPSGKDGEMTIQLRNLSETGEDGWYNINVVDTTNPDGLQVSLDGYNITNGRTILIPAGGEGVTKKLYFHQSNTAVTDYKDVVIRVSSICQPDNTGIFPAIESMLPVSITFQPAGSDIELLASETVVNTYTQAPLRLSMRGYDINAKALESVRLQYKGLNDAQWLTLKEYVKEGDPRLATDKSLGTLIAIEGTNTLDYELDLRDALYTDQTYVFRAQTVCAAAGSYIYGESQNLQVVRDMHRPQLMGNASPSDGVLNPGDEISIVFNEDVRSNELGKAENFSVRGVLNDSQLTHDAALQLTAGGDGAKTTSTIDLSGRSFTLGTWMRYSAAGHVFQHGDATTGLDVSVNADNKLEVTLAGQKLTSTETLRPDTWLYLSVAYDNDEKTLSAHYAYDSYSVDLLRAQSLTAAANGSEAAALTVGRGLTGSMHEVTLWDYAQDWTEALGGIYTYKNKTTRGLIGYWKLDEGHGTLATDYSRSRHMTVPALGAWYIAQENHALTMDGHTVAQLPIAESLKATDDYTLETWFMADKTNGAASIIGFGTDAALDVRLNAAGKMEVACGTTAAAVGTKDYRDGQWHHVALNVLRSENGRATVYVDGEALKQVNGVPALQTASIIVGGAQQTGGTWGGALNGAIDEVRVWRGSRSAETLKASMNHRVNPADEPALMMYYPFEETTLDAYQQTVVQPTMADKTAGEGVLACIVGEGVATSAATAPSLKAAPRVENIPFTYVADERRIVINLDAEPARLEGCNVEITVHSVSDKNGNYCLPITWTAFVQQNQLKWADDAVELTTASAPCAFSATIVNQSGNSDSWALSGLPTWLTVDAENGTLQPLAQKTLNFSVSDALAIGSHEAVIYLTGAMGINTPLVVSVTNLGDVPEWSVNPADFESTMNIYGQLCVDGLPSKDKNDIVAAFRGTECVGVAHPEYKARYDAYYVMMNVYGNDADSGTPLKYKVYDASTGQILPVAVTTDKSADVFTPDAVIGSLAQPYLWTTSDRLEQNFALKAGWQWISFYVNPDKASASDLMAEVEDDVNVMLSENLSYTPVTNGIRRVSPATMYKLNMRQAAALDVVGTAVRMDDTPVSIKAGWNWIGYPASGAITLEEAFADLEPEENDMVKGQTGFATWDEYEWVGTLTALRGGEGYQYRSGREAERTFHYPAYSAADGARKAPRLDVVSPEQAEAASAYASNMNAIALVTRDGIPVDEATIRIVDSEARLRAVSEQSVRDGRHFLTIAGDTEGDALRVIVTLDGFDYLVPGTLFFAPDVVVGTLKAPLAIDLESPTGIGTLRFDDDAAEGTYDLSGRPAAANSGVQVIIADGKKMVVK